MRLIELLIAADPRKQGGVAVAAKMTPQELNDKLKGRRTMFAKDIVALAAALGVDPAILVVKIAKEDLLKLASESSESDDAVVGTRAGRPKGLRLKESAEHAASPRAPELKEPPVPAYLPEPDYSAAIANRLRVIRSITYQGDDAVSRVIAPFRLAASPPEQLDANDEGTVSIPAAESEVRNAPIFPVKVFGTSMNNVIDAGDIVFYRRSREPKKDAIVIAFSRGGLTMKRLRGKKLHPDSTDEHETITPLDDDGLIGEVVAIHKPPK